MLRYFVTLIFVDLKKVFLEGCGRIVFILEETERGWCFHRKINKVTVYGRYIEIELRNTVPFLGESQKEMYEHLKELRGFGNYREVNSSIPEKALEGLGGV
jgi:hypothetical protein